MESETKKTAVNYLGVLWMGTEASEARWDRVKLIPSLVCGHDLGPVFRVASRALTSAVVRLSTVGTDWYFGPDPEEMVARVAGARVLGSTEKIWLFDGNGRKRLVCVEGKDVDGNPILMDMMPLCRYFVGQAKDGRTAVLDSTNDREVHVVPWPTDAAGRPLRSSEKHQEVKATTWLNEHYPKWRDPSAYWDDHN